MQMRIPGIMAAALLVAAWSAPAPPSSQVTNFSAQLTGTAETPPNTSKATGMAALKLDGNELHYTLTVRGLSGPATAAHLHVGTVGQSGAPVVKLQITSAADGLIADDSVNLSPNMGMNVSPDSVKKLLFNGAAYVNVHTAAFANGEIRGQVTKP